MNHRWAILCERASVDQASNNISLFNIIDEILVNYVGKEPTADQQIAVPQPFTFAVLTERSDLNTPETGSMRVKFKDASGKELMNARTVQIDMQKFLRTRSMINSNVVPIRGPGTYKFVVEYQDSDTTKWKKVAEVPVLIKFSPATENAQQEIAKKTKENVH